MPKGSKWQELFALEQWFLYMLFGLSFVSRVRQSALNSIWVHPRSAHYRTLLPFAGSFWYPLWQQYLVNFNSFITNSDVNRYIYIAAYLGNCGKDQRNRTATALDSAKSFHPCKSPWTSPWESHRSHRHHFISTGALQRNMGAADPSGQAWYLCDKHKAFCIPKCKIFGRAEVSWCPRGVWCHPNSSQCLPPPCRHQTRRTLQLTFLLQTAANKTCY